MSLFLFFCFINLFLYLSPSLSSTVGEKKNLWHPNQAPSPPHPHRPPHNGTQTKTSQFHKLPSLFPPPQFSHAGIQLMGFSH